MNKALIAVLVVGIGYIGYNSLQGESTTPSSDTLTEQSKKESKKMYEEYQPTEEEKSAIYGTYAVKIDNKKMVASQVYTLNTDGTFDHTRTMSQPKDINANTTGTFELEGNLLTLVFNGDRDKSDFPLESIKMAVTKSGSIMSGKNELLKQ